MAYPTRHGDGLLVVSDTFPLDRSPFAAPLQQTALIEAQYADILNMTPTTIEETIRGTMAVLFDWSLIDLEALIKLRKIIAGQPLYAFGPEDALAQVTALQLGADDYLKTPILPILLEARLNAFHRLVPKEPARTNGIRAFSLDESTRTVRKGNASAQLRNKEYQLLKCLLRDPGALCTTDRLLDEVWGINFDTGTNPLAVQIAALRKKLRHIGVPEAIITLRGVGYRLNPRLVG